jgi:hypothetical protein
MGSNRRTLLLMGAASGGLVWATFASGQSFPTKPLRWILGVPAGGGLDIQARILAGQSLSHRRLCHRSRLVDVRAFVKFARALNRGAKGRVCLIPPLFHSCAFHLAANSSHSAMYFWFGIGPGVMVLSI